jgi:Uma2 family endonuclease
MPNHGKKAHMNQMLPKLVSSHGAAQFSGEEYLELVARGAFAKPYDCELVDGELARMTPPYLKHQRLSGLIFRQLAMLLDTGTVMVIHEPLVRLQQDTLRVPDIGIMTAQSLEARYVPAADVLVAIEISDTTLATDLGDKLRDYAQAKIADYLVVDLQGEVVHHCTGPRESDYAARRIIRFGEPISLLGQSFTITAPTA